jgi:uncharacterized protein (DUF2252 family)
MHRIIAVPMTRTLYFLDRPKMKQKQTDLVRVDAETCCIEVASACPVAIHVSNWSGRWSVDVSGRRGHSAYQRYVLMIDRTVGEMASAVVRLVHKIHSSHHLLESSNDYAKR